MPYSAGSASLSIVPDFSGISDQIEAEAEKWGESAGSTFGSAFAEAAREGTSDAIPSEEAQAAEKGSSAGGAFGDAFRARVEAALAALPEADIRANTTEFDEELADIRAELETLGNQRIGIDISDDDALAKLAELKAALAEIGASSENITVRVNAAEATAEIEGLEAEVAAADASMGSLGADAGGAGGGLEGLGADAGESGSALSALVPALVALAAALVPIGGLAGGALAALPGILAGAGAGLGALKLGLGGISGALSAYGQQQTTAAKSTTSATESAATQAQQAISNAASIRNAANSVAQAQGAVATAQVSADDSVRQASESLASAQQSAADSVRSANEQVIASEQQLADAEYTEQQAQEALTQAREDAANQLTDYADQLSDGSLSIQQAQLDIQTAQAGVTAAGPGSGDTAQQQQQAQLTYEQAVQRLQDLQDQQSQLQQTAAEANAAGVDGAASVVQAQHQLLDANNAVTSAQQAQSDAVIAASEAQAAAVQNVTNAQIAYSEAQASAVQKVTDAQNALTTALQNQADTLATVALSGQTAAGSGGGSAAATPNTFAQDMAKLTDQGRQFVYFLLGIKSQIDALGNSVQAILLPGLQAGITAALPLFGPLSLYIENAAQGIGDFVDELGHFLGSAQGVSEVNAIFSQGAGFMSDMANAAFSVIGAFLSIGSQAGPIVSAIGSGVDHLASAFAKWASDGGFQGFLTWLHDNGPDIVSDVSSIVKGFGSFIVATEPLGKALLDIAGAIGRVVSALSGPLSLAAKGIAILLEEPVRAINDLVQAIDYLSTHWQQLWADIEQWADAGYAHVKSAVFDPLVDFFTVTIPQIFDEVVAWFQALPGRIVSALGDFVNTIFGALKLVGAWLENNVWGPFSTWWIQLPGRVATALGDFFSAAFAALLRAGSWLEGNVAAPVLGWFTGLPGRIAAGLSDFLGVAFATLAGVGSWLESNVWTPISSFFSGLGSRIATAAAGMWDGIGNAFIDILNAIINLWDGLHFSIGGGSFLGVSFPSFTLGLPHVDDINPISTRAGGGGVDAGGTYLIGEKGPEILQMPNTSGFVTPNSALDLSGLGGGSSRPTAPVFDNSEMHFHNEAEINGLMRQASFVRKARVL